MIALGTAFMGKQRITETQPETASEEAQQRQVFKAYYGRVYGFFKSRDFADDEALDLTQETFFRVFQNMGNLRSQASLDSWILRIAANVWKNEIRYRHAGRRDA